MAAVSTAATAQAQPRTFPNYANLELVRAEAFTGELRLDPHRLGSAAIESIRQRVSKAGIYVSSLDLSWNHIDPDPAKRETQNQYVGLSLMRL